MSISEKLAALAGKWKGTNRLNQSWLPDPIAESPSTADVSRRLNGQFLEIAYTWEFEGKLQEGLLILGGDNKSDAVNAFWTDSWHLAHQVMLCEGTAADNGSISVKGYYKVPDHPDWGWRTEIIPAADSFKYVMWNVSPDGDEELATETEFVRD